MRKFDEVCLLSCENWVDSFPSEIPKHKFSEKHNEKMEELFRAGPRKSKHKLSGKTIRILLIAAILLAVATTVFAIPSCREFIVKQFSDHSEYQVSDTENAEKVESLELGYIPEGFEKAEDYKSDYLYRFSYKNDQKYFNVDKHKIDAEINFDTEKYSSENIQINGIQSIYFASSNKEHGVIFNNGEYIFIISGNIEKDELVKIAQNVK